MFKVVLTSRNIVGAVIVHLFKVDLKLKKSLFSHFLSTFGYGHGLRRVTKLVPCSSRTLMVIKLAVVTSENTVGAVLVHFFSSRIQTEKVTFQPLFVTFWQWLWSGKGH